MNYNRPKTIFCDIDGTLWNHVGTVSKQAAVCSHQLLPNTLKALDRWDRLGYKIILTTGRKESMRKITKEHLESNGIVYDKLIMGLGGGDRILINDRKLNGNRNTAYAINVVRNKGIQHYDFTNKYVTIPDDVNQLVDKNNGYENIIDYNDNYIVKKIFMKKDSSTDIQYHELKRKTIYILSGKIKLYLGSKINSMKESILSANETINISSNTIYKIEVLEECNLLESSSNELNDVIKIK